MSRKTNKTASVLRLISANDTSGLENPILNKQFKDENILNRSKSDTEIKGKDNTDINTNSNNDSKIKINIISKLVNDNIDNVLHRFNVCDCDLCKTEVSVCCLKEIEPIYIYAENENDEIVKKEITKYYSKVMSQLVRNVIKLKFNPIH